MPASPTDFLLFDSCPRLHTWSRSHQPPRISLSIALHNSLNKGLEEGSAQAGKDHFISLCADPGLAIKAYNVYEIGIHHAHLVEVIAAYLLGDGKWVKADPFRNGGYIHRPNSFLMKDGRLRRVVLCDRWDDTRQLAETHSWRTLADVCATNRPMLINAITIGQSRKGFRPSPWTRAHKHHTAGNTLQLTRKDGSDFAPSWTRLWRENTSESSLDWLRRMQEEQCFADLIHSFVVDVPGNREEILMEMRVMVGEMEKGSLKMRRSSCFFPSPCPFSPLCHSPSPSTPELARWKRVDEC